MQLRGLSRRCLVSMLAAVVLAGCGGLPTPGSEAPEECGFPPGTMVTLVGETPIAALGLKDPAVEVEEEDPEGGTVYVTTEPVRRATDERFARVWCAVYGPEAPQGFIATSGPVPGGWTPPDG